MLGPAHLPRHPLLLARFGVPALLPATVLGRTVVSRRARSGAVRRLRRPLGAAPHPAGERRGRPALPVHRRTSRPGRSRRAGRRRSPARSPHTCGRSAAASRPGGRSGRSGRSALRRASCSSTPAPTRSQTSRQPGAAQPRTSGACAGYRYGPGIFKIDWALDGPIPWTRPRLPRRGDGPRRRHPRRDRRRRRPPSGAASTPTGPSSIVVQPSLFDPSRAPAGKHTGWAYCHVPAGLDARPHRRRRAPGRALRARVPRSHPRPPRDAAPPISSDTTRTTSAARSPAASPISASCSPARSSRANPYSTPNSDVCHLLRLDAPRRRRARHVRLLRGARRAPPSGRRAAV